jgi:hypothetical protein
LRYHGGGDIPLLATTGRQRDQSKVNPLQNEYSDRESSIWPVSVSKTSFSYHKWPYWLWITTSSQVLDVLKTSAVDFVDFVDFDNCEKPLIEPIQSLLVPEATWVK